MNLVMLNGSPRGKKSNTQILLNQLCIGMNSVNCIECNTYYLNQTKKTEEHIAVVKEAELIVLGFPLYTDGMPGIVKHFIDSLYPIDLQGTPIAFLVQSGFPEAKHSRAVARYLEKLCKRINATHCGTIIRGGSEGIHLTPDKVNRKIFEQFNALGASLAYDGKFKQDLLDKVAGAEELSWVRKQGMKLPISNFYWNMMLKKNNAFGKRFDAPYAPAFSGEKEKEK
jgi:hypothetical protein